MSTTTCNSHAAMLEALKAIASMKVNEKSDHKQLVALCMGIAETARAHAEGKEAPMQTHTEQDDERKYPSDVAKEVAAMRPDLCTNDAVSVVLTADPTLTAQDVIAILDEATADHEADAGETKESES